jgi:hypothetical protein
MFINGILPRKISDALEYAYEVSAISIEREEKRARLETALMDIYTDKPEDTLAILNRLVGIDEFYTSSKVVHETFVHSVSTAVYASILVEADRLNEREKLSIVQAALFHDIGKSDVEKDILFKPARLTDSEFDAVKKHAAYGPLYLMAYADYRPEIPIASLYHHFSTKKYGYDEQIDGFLPDYIKDYVNGNGYQRHVVDIVSICDSISAVVDDRTYSDGDVNKLSMIMNELYGMSDGKIYTERCKKNISYAADVLNITIAAKENTETYVRER